MTYKKLNDSELEETSTRIIKKELLDKHKAQLTDDLSRINELLAYFEE